MRSILSLLLFSIVRTIAFCSTGDDPCTAVSVTKTTIEPLSWNADSTLFLANKKDSAGVYQIWVGSKKDPKLRCISFKGPESKIKPWNKRNKMQVMWHPSGQWIVCAVEKEKFNEEWLKGTRKGRDLIEGWLQCGLWMDIWMVKPDGSNWCLLAKTIHGMTGPAFTPNGKTAVWAEALDDSCNLMKDKFGCWRMVQSEFAVDSAGHAHFTSSKIITPAGAKWVEPGNFAPDGKCVLLSADIGLADARGQDQYILNIETGEVVNLTNSPKVWDEHGVFSPDGKKILFMSSWPYRDDKNSYKVTGIKTEFMIMNRDGSGLQQLTHFRAKGYPESNSGIAAIGFFGPDGQTIYSTTLIFPKYEYFIIKMKGKCWDVKP